MSRVQKMGANRQTEAEHRETSTSKALLWNVVGDGSRDSNIWAPRQGEDKAEGVKENFLACSVQGH